MQLNLNSSSIVARLYQWFYSTKTMPTSILLYFLHLSLMSVLIIPYFIITIPSILAGRPNNENFTERILFAIAWYIPVLILISMITFIIIMFTPTEDILKISENELRHSLTFNFAAVGLISWVSLLIVLIYNLIKLIATHVITKFTKILNALKHYFKSIGNKCPQRINWN